MKQGSEAGAADSPEGWGGEGGGGGAGGGRGGSGWEDTCTPVVDSYQCMAKKTTTML